MTLRHHSQTIGAGLHGGAGELMDLCLITSLSAASPLVTASSSSSSAWRRHTRCYHEHGRVRQPRGGGRRQAVELAHIE